MAVQNWRKDAADIRRRWHGSGKGGKVSLTTLADLERSGRRIHRGNVVNVHQLLPTAEVGAVKDGTVLYVLREKSDGILSAVRFDVRQIHIVHEEHHLLPHGRSVVRSGPLVDVALHLPLEGEGRTIVRHHNVLAHDAIGFLVEPGQIILDDLRLAGAGVAHQHSVPPIPHQPVQQIRHPRRVDRFHEEAVEGDHTWTIPNRPRDVSLHLGLPMDVAIGFHIKEIVKAR
mmetsp:Transcript_31985/g.94084  ORF Transcript_31985/g.94084 Transcript_31985/m.94084 type:complete len:229 (+) Transcript_31985:736-1422(+)